MNTPIKAFVYYQLSLFHLGYGNLIKSSTILADRYVKLSADLKHYNAIHIIATDQMYISPNNSIALFKESIKLGNVAAIDDLMDCYALLGDFDNITDYYKKNLINLSQYVGLFNTILHKEQLIYKFIITLIVEDNIEVKKILFKYNGLFSEEIFDKLNLYMNENDDQKSVILENMLIIFNSNNLLYIGYMSKNLKCLKK
jgi:hypothetical protein